MLDGRLSGGLRDTLLPILGTDALGTARPVAARKPGLFIDAARIVALLAAGAGIFGGTTQMSDTGKLATP